MKKTTQWMVTGLLCLFAAAIAVGTWAIKPISWSQCLVQKPGFYAGNEAVRIADNVLLYQRNSGGWQKGVDMARVLSEKDKAQLRKDKIKEDCTLDNGATHTQMRYLARVYDATKLERFRQAFLKAVDYLLEAQYPNGGWPQRYPTPWSYTRYITFNDGAMIGAMTVLRDIAEKKRRMPSLVNNAERRPKRPCRRASSVSSNARLSSATSAPPGVSSTMRRTLSPGPLAFTRKYQSVVARASAWSNS